MVGIIETCIEASCSAFADMLGGFAGPGIIGAFIEPFLGEAPCGPVTFAEACGTLMGK